MEVERVRVMEADRNRELQEQFIDMTCHELRNPLNAIYNSSVLLSESLARIKSTVNLLQTADATAQLRSICLDIEAEVDENIDCAQTIVMCAKHQQRIADGRYSSSVTPCTCAFSRSD
jgi:signal transduction histidine kinase